MDVRANKINVGCHCAFNLVVCLIMCDPQHSLCAIKITMHHQLNVQENKLTYTLCSKDKINRALSCFAASSIYESLAEFMGVFIIKVKF